MELSSSQRCRQPGDDVGSGSLPSRFEHDHVGVVWVHKQVCTISPSHSLDHRWGVQSIILTGDHKERGCDLFVIDRETLHGLIEYLPPRFRNKFRIQLIEPLDRDPVEFQFSDFPPRGHQRSPQNDFRKMADGSLEEGQTPYPEDASRRCGGDRNSCGDMPFHRHAPISDAPSTGTMRRSPGTVRVMALALGSTVQFSMAPPQDLSIVSKSMSLTVESSSPSSAARKPPEPKLRLKWNRQVRMREDRD
jgi:hypothetical protein